MNVARPWIHAALALLLGDITAQTSYAQLSVQLPTFRVTGVSTTVVVPDRGGVYLGGVTNSSIGTGAFGSPFGGHLPGLRRNLGNRSFARSTTTSNFWVGATIIDHAEIDRALLAEADRRRNRRRAAPQQDFAPAAPEDQPVRVEPANDSPPGLDGESQRSTLYLVRAERAETQGQPQVAKIFYQRVAKHGTDAQKRQAERRLASIEAARRK